jgi:hypothetical protein
MVSPFATIIPFAAAGNGWLRTLRALTRCGSRHTVRVPPASKRRARLPALLLGSRRSGAPSVDIVLPPRDSQTVTGRWRPVLLVLLGALLSPTVPSAAGAVEVDIVRVAPVSITLERVKEHAFIGIQAVLRPDGRSSVVSLGGRNVQIRTDDDEISQLAFILPLERRVGATHVDVLRSFGPTAAVFDGVVQAPGPTGGGLIKLFELYDIVFDTNEDFAELLLIFCAPTGPLTGGELIVGPAEVAFRVE